MQLFLPYGHTALPFAAPDDAAVLLPRHEARGDRKDGAALVREAMAHPIGTPTLRELARGKRTCTLIISDHTRPVPSRDILPPMLRELREGNPDIDVTLLVATGCHRLTTAEELTAKLGSELAARERIVVHDCTANNVAVGTLPSLAPLFLDRVAAEADLLVAEGFIEPHFFAGFSGGRKSVLPGVCGRETVLGNHCSAFIDSPNARTGRLDGNPIHADMLAAARLARLAYIVNVVVDEEKRTLAAFAGDFEAAHRAGCDWLRQRCVVSSPRADIVVSTNGGAPLVQNLYQCVKGLTAAEAAARPGGVLILCAACADGVGGDGFYRALASCESAAALYDAILRTPQAKTVPDQWQSQVLARVLRAHPVILVTRPELADAVRAMKMTYAASVGEAFSLALRRVGGAPRVAVIPDGVGVIVE